MAENPTPAPENDDKSADAEKAFWEKFTGNLDTWWDGKMKSYQEARDKAGPGTSRTGGKRTTLPDLVADIIFGPPKE